MEMNVGQCCFFFSIGRVKGSIVFGVFILIPSLVFMVMTGTRYR